MFVPPTLKNATITFKNSTIIYDEKNVGSKISLEVKVPPYEENVKKKPRGILFYSPNETFWNYVNNNL